MSGTPPRQLWKPPTPAEMEALLPAYEFHALIGRGGMGAVFKATQRSLNRTVAIKVLPAKFMEDVEANFTARFRREALTMATLTHSGIVGVFDSGEAGGLLYIIMEFVDGTDVARLIASEGRLAPGLATKLITEVCEALHYAHEQGVIHRDIKPANLLLSRDGTVKIADFGLAKRDDPDLHGLTRSDIAVGTPDFLAPEAWTPNARLDRRSDVYSLGVTFYQMLTGEVPRGFWEMPSTRVGTDPRFDAVIERALQPKPEARYESSAELRRDLERIQGRCRAPSARPRGRAVALAILAVAVAAGLVALVWPRPPAWVVTNALDHGRGSLRQTILDAPPGAVVTFAPKLSGRTILLTNGHLMLNKDLTIDGSGLKRAVCLDGNRASRVFYVSNVTVILRSMVITNGHARDLDDANIGGGGVYNAGRLEVSHCTLVGNSSTGGGGAIGSRSPLVVTRCTLTGNRAFGGGGIGIYGHSGGTLTVIHSTISGNRADGSGPVGLGGDIFNYNSAMTNFNSIASDVHINQGLLHLAGVNLIEKYGAYGVQTPENPAPITRAPRLAAFGEHGGPLPTLPPLPGSPAIDTGGPAQPGVDQRGFAFPAGLAPDIGAAEVETRRVVVTTAADSGAGSLRQAVLDLDTNEVCTIAFAPALSGKVISLVSGEIVLATDMAISASDLPAGIGLDGGGRSRIFRLGAGVRAVMDSLTISNGAGWERGGGIRVERRATLTLNDCAVINNSLRAPASYESEGGGISLDSASFTANRCTISGNRAALGAGIGGGSSVLTLNQCTVAGNLGGKVGGIRIVYGSLELNHCTVTANSCEPGESGGLLSVEASVTLFNSIVAGNRDADEVTIPGRFLGGNLTRGNPHLAPLGRYGGRTATMPPLPGSPALEAGAVSALASDQRGYPRPVGAGPDLGAVEGMFVPGEAFIPAARPPRSLLR